MLIGGAVRRLLPAGGAGNLPVGGSVTLPAGGSVIVLLRSLHSAVSAYGKCCSDALPDFLAPLRRPLFDDECCEDAGAAACRCPHSRSNCSFVSSCFLNLLRREAVSTAKTKLEKPFDKQPSHTGSTMLSSRNWRGAPTLLFARLRRNHVVSKSSGRWCTVCPSRLTRRRAL